MSRPKAGAFALQCLGWNPKGYPSDRTNPELEKTSFAEIGNKAARPSHVLPYLNPILSPSFGFRVKSKLNLPGHRAGRGRVRR